MADPLPLYPTETQALAAPGEIYRHFKGGIYRVVLRGVKHSERDEVGIVYEHLWPHDHGFWYRPESIFSSPQGNGEPRFVLIKKSDV